MNCQFQNVYDRLDLSVLGMAEKTLNLLWPLARDDSEFDLEEKIGSGGLAANARYLASTLLTILGDHGCVRARSHSRFGEFRRARLQERKERLAERCRDDVAGQDPVFGLLDRCHANLREFLNGRYSGVDILFPRGDTTDWAALHDRSQIMRHYTDQAVQLVAKRAGPRGRCLEFGAGTGAALRRLATHDAVGKWQTYTFTDISLAFTRAAEMRFSSLSCFEARRLDFNADPIMQGFEAESYDVVFGVNALHVAPDIATTLKGLKGLLRPGGWLILGEGCPPADHRWRADPLFAFLKDWWDLPRDPALRRQPGFLPPESWYALLSRAGLSMVDTDGFETGTFGGALSARKAG